MIPIYIIKCYSCGDDVEGVVKFKRRICFGCKKLQRKVRMLKRNEKRVAKLLDNIV